MRIRIRVTKGTYNTATGTRILLNCVEAGTVVDDMAMFTAKVTGLSGRHSGDIKEFRRDSVGFESPDERTRLSEVAWCLM
jgi:hypothetical protein